MLASPSYSHCTGTECFKENFLRSYINVCVCVVMSLRISLIDMSNFHQSCKELFFSKQKGKVILNFHVKEIQKIKRKQQGLEALFSE